MRLPQWVVMVGILCVWSCASSFAAETVADAANVEIAQGTVAEAYPGLASSSLTHARLADLPAGVLARIENIDVAEAELASMTDEAPEKVRDQLRQNAFFVLEHLATSKMLLVLAKKDAASIERDISKVSDNELINGWLRGELDAVEVSDSEVTAFYDENKSMFGGAALNAVKAQIIPFLRQQKQQEAMRSIIESLGRKIDVKVSASWVKSQSVLSMDNPVDKARQSGMPTMVDFGRDGCGPCDMMAPILETLKKKLDGKANVVFVHVGDEEVLAMRFGIESIPVQVFFDKAGTEVFRHTGFFPQEEIEKKLAELGVQ